MTGDVLLPFRDLVEAGRLLALPLVVLGALFFAVLRSHLRRRSPTGTERHEVTWGEVGVLALGAACLAVVYHWPLPLYLTSQIPSELQDPVLQAWHLAWGGHALLTQPLHAFQANVHWPLPNALAVTDGMIGFAPLGVLAQSSTGALAEYNVLLVFAYALAGAGAYLLARELGVRAGVAAVAGAAFAYAPWRVAESNHLNVLSSGGIPLALFLLLRGYRRRSAGSIVAGWLVAVWQLSLGFALGLQFAYLLAALGVIALVLWLQRGRPALGRAVAIATVAGVAAFAVVGGLLASPYLTLVREVPGAARDLGDVKELSPPPRAYLAAASENILWARATAGPREELRSEGEQALFPGVLTVALALGGLASAVYSRRLRLGLAAGIFLLVVLSLGLSLAGGRYSYLWLYEYAPGWAGVRTPGRLMTLVSLGLALLAAAGAEPLLRRLRRPLTVGLMSVALVGVVVTEGFNRVDLTPVPPSPAGQRGLSAPQVHLPIDLTPNQLYAFWSIDDGFPLLLNGGGSPPDTLLTTLQDRIFHRFPDRRTVAELRAVGVRAVILHPDLARGTGWSRMMRRPVTGLPLRKTERGSVVVYEIPPRPAG